MVGIFCVKRVFIFLFLGAENRKIRSLRVKKTLLKIHKSLKKFQLLSWCIGRKFFLVVEQFYFAELFVRDGYHSYMPKFRKHGFDPLQMHIGILTTGTMPHINGELKHGKSIAQQFLSELSRLVPFFFCVGWQVEENKYPHDAILAESGVVHGMDISG